MNRLILILIASIVAFYSAMAIDAVGNAIQTAKHAPVASIERAAGIAKP